jgi:hypothetical protein
MMILLQWKREAQAPTHVWEVRAWARNVWESGIAGRVDVACNGI